MTLPIRMKWALAGLAAAAPALAADHAARDDADFHKRFGPFGGGNPFGSDSPFSGYNPFSSSGGTDGFPNFLGGISLEDAIHYRTIHGILASLAMVVLFPVGAMLMRIVPGRAAIWVHGLFQVMAFLVFVAAAALGIYLVKKVTIPFGGGNLLTNPSTNIHPIMGLVALGTLFFQPLLGYIHHARFKQLGRRTFWSHLHLWNGRIGVTVGIINGGLGLRLADATYSVKVAYIVVAAIVWSLWLVVAVFSEIRRARTTKTAGVAGVPYSRASSRGGGRAHGGGGSGAYYAARAPGSRGTHLGRSPSARGSSRGGSRTGPEMMETRTVSATSTPAPAGGGRQASRPRRSGQRSPKDRPSPSSSDISVSPERH